MHHKSRFHHDGGPSRRHLGRFRSHTSESLATPEERALREARMALKTVLREKKAASAEEHRRIMAILARATEEILSKPAN